MNWENIKRALHIHWHWLVVYETPWHCLRCRCGHKLLALDHGSPPSSPLPVGWEEADVVR